MAVQRPQEIEDLARFLVANDCRFEIEVLTTGEVSMEIVRRKTPESEPETLALEICPNGPEVPIAVDKMIQNGHKAFQEIREADDKNR